MVFWRWKVCLNHLPLFENVYSFISFSLPGNFLSWYFLNKHCVSFYYSLTCWSWHWTGSLGLDIRLPRSVHSWNLLNFTCYHYSLYSSALLYHSPSSLSQLSPWEFSLYLNWTTNVGLQISRVIKYAWSKCICVCVWHIGYSGFRNWD